LVTENSQPLSIATVWTEAHGEILVSALANAGIEAYVICPLTGELAMVSPVAVEIWVHGKDAVEGLIVLEKIKNESGEIEWANVELGKVEV